jgi:hypothetical protein
MSESDLDAFGRLLAKQRPSVRYRVAGTPDLMPTIPKGAWGMVAAIDGGRQVSVIPSRITGNDMHVGEVVVLLDPADEDHVKLWDNVTAVVKRLTKPHVAFLDGRTANVRVGPDAEAWWLADEARSFVDGPAIRYRLREQRDAR